MMRDQQLYACILLDTLSYCCSEKNNSNQQKIFWSAGRKKIRYPRSTRKLSQCMLHIVKSSL